MRIAVTAVTLTLLVLLLAGLSIVWSGVYDVAATDAHSAPVRWLLEQARTRSIQAHAANIVAPPALDDPAKVRQGMEHFAAHCAVCHGAPGVPKGEIARGMYPQPPDLTAAAKHMSAAELFWIVKNGIKMTGMPAWRDHGDAELWSTVAFLRKLPTMTEAEYVTLLRDAMAGDGHDHGSAHDGGGDGSHGHGEGHGAPSETPASKP
jgi:mono/diheme cytochrome c family protein